MNFGAIGQQFSPLDLELSDPLPYPALQYREGNRCQILLLNREV
jgi:hypothetical protein